MAVEVRLLLEFLDEVPIASCVHLPVNRRQIVARDVLPVLGEFDAEAFERTAMEAREKAFDDGAGFELQCSQTRNDRRVQERALGGGRGHGYIPLAGRGTVS